MSEVPEGGHGHEAIRPLCNILGRKGFFLFLELSLLNYVGPSHVNRFNSSHGPCDGYELSNKLRSRGPVPGEW